MNHIDLVGRIAWVGGITKAEASKSLELVINVISDALAKGEEVRVHNFGTFKVKQNPAKQGRNPATGETIEIPAKKVAKFQPSKPLADKVNA